MKTHRIAGIIFAAVTILGYGAISPAAAEEYGAPWGTELSIMGGFEALNENDTAFPDRFVNVPVALSLAYPLTSVLAVEGDFTWIIPIEQSVDLGGGTNTDLSTPDVLSYQANLRANLPLGQASFRPYVTAGAGAITFLSNTKEDRKPQLDKSETAFAVNFGVGTTYALTGSWAVRADFREFLALPSDDAAGISNNGTADEIWMERGMLGLAYRF
jgi:opacity protein-like surface antigen